MYLLQALFPPPQNLENAPLLFAEFFVERLEILLFMCSDWCRDQIILKWLVSVRVVPNVR